MKIILFNRKTHLHTEILHHFLDKPASIMNDELAKQVQL